MSEEDNSSVTEDIENPAPQDEIQPQEDSLDEEFPAEESVDQGLDDDASPTETETLEKDEKSDQPDEKNVEEEDEKDPKWLQKRLAREQRKHQRELDALKRSYEAKIQNDLQNVEGLLTEDQTKQYQQRLIEQQNQQIQVQEAVKEQRFAKQMVEALDKYEDFEALVKDPEFDNCFTEAMLLAAKNTPNGAELIYHLSKNKKETARISRLPVDQQIREMYLVEGNVIHRTKPIKSSAPPPISQTKAVPKSKETDSTKMSYAQIVENERRKLEERFGSL